MSDEAVIVTVILLVLALLVIGLYSISIYNRLHSLRQRVREARSNVLVVLRKRLDLAARLVQIAAKYGDHEQLVLLKLSADRAFAGNNLSASSDAVRGMFALTASYPELRASETYEELSQQLTALESEIQGRRELLNGVVRVFDTERDAFPTSLFAGMLRIAPESYFDADAEGLQDVAPIFESGFSAALRQVQTAHVATPALRGRTVAEKQAVASAAEEATVIDRFAPSDSSAHALLFTAGPRQGDRVPIKPQGMHIGRDITVSDVVVEDSRISRRHLWIGVVDGRLKVRDTGSSNGTYINHDGARIVEAEVSSGDIVALGEKGAAFRVE